MFIVLILLSELSPAQLVITVFISQWKPVFIIHLRGYSSMENEQCGQFTFLFWREQLRNASRFTTHLPSYYSSYQTFSLFVDFFMTVVVVVYITPCNPQVSRFIDSALLHKVKDKFLGIHWALLEFLFPIEPLLSNQLLCGGRFKERDVGYNSFLLSLRSFSKLFHILTDSELEWLLTGSWSE